MFHVAIISFGYLIVNDGLRMLGVFYSFFFGFFGNHPFLTRSRCWKSSKILHRLEQPVTPKIAAISVLETKSEATSNRMPAAAKIGQQRTPQ